MTLTNEESAEASSGRRDRSYSDAHALIYSKTNNPHSPPQNTAGGASHMNKAAHTKKHHHHHHHGRPRSKSLDIHRHHSSPFHKKKYPHQHYKHIPSRTHSPAIHHYGSGRASPSSPKLRGKMWIRPAPSPASGDTMSGQCDTPFFPALQQMAGGEVVLSPSSREHVQMVAAVGGEEFMNTSPLNDSPVRQVTDGTTSPSLRALHLASSFDDDMAYYASPNSSFDYYQQHQHTSPSRIIFGESGKPISKPRPAFDYHPPAAQQLLIAPLELKNRYEVSSFTA